MPISAHATIAWRFPGDIREDKITYGDPEALEAAICFPEVRPYFFRSGYMFKDILRKCRRAPLSRNQADRLRANEKRLLEWREQKAAKNKAELARG